MTEQNLTPDADDTEGQMFHRDDENISDADTEGHRVAAKADDADDADDTEGHRRL